MLDKKGGINMSFEQLTYMIAVEQYGSFSKAAENLFISQSAMSQSILRLEIEIQVTLFNRSTHPITLTPQGLLLLAQAKIIIAEKNKFHSLATSVKFSFRLGFIKGLYLPFITNLFDDHRAPTTPYAITYVENNSLELANQIKHNQLDIALLAMYPETMKILSTDQIFPILQIEVFVYVHKNSPLALHESIHASDLLDASIIIYDGPYMQWFISQYEKQIGPLNLLFATQNTYLINKSIVSNIAIVLDTKTDYQKSTSNQYDPDIIAIPLANTIVPATYFGIAYSHKIKNNTFFGHIIETVDTLIKKSI